MKYLKYRLATLMFAGMMFAGSRSSPSVGTAQPLWTFDLVVSGYQAVETTRDKALSISSSNEGIVFIENGTVAVYFVTKAETPELSNRKDATIGSPFRLRAVFGDIENRKIRLTNDWPTRTFPSSLIPTADGKLIVSAGDSLQLYSSQLTLIKERRLEASGQRFESWHVKSSPTGRVLWLDHEDGPSKVEVLDATSLRTLSAWEEEALGPRFSVSDHAVAKSPPQAPQHVMIKTIGGSWRVLYDAGTAMCAGAPNFVNDEILITGPCGSVGLVSTSGAIVMTDKMPKGEHLEGEIAASRNGEMAAVSIMRTHGGAFDTSIRRSDTTIVVYDVEHRKAILKVEVNPVPKSSYHFALSPDGASLAVMTDSIVKIYDTKKTPLEHGDAKASTRK
jgi:hypothetical protein